MNRGLYDFIWQTNLVYKMAIQSESGAFHGGLARVRFSSAIKIAVDSCEKDWKRRNLIRGVYWAMDTAAYCRLTVFSYDSKAVAKFDRAVLKALGDRNLTPKQNGRVLLASMISLVLDHPPPLRPKLVTPPVAKSVITELRSLEKHVVF